ncbi:MAG: hypothetical protein QXT53_08415 [Ignisphaera sp.]
MAICSRQEVSMEWLLEMLRNGYSNVDENMLKKDLVSALCQLFMYGYIEVDGKSIVDFYFNRDIRI